jgi:hypothetical protein
MIERAMPIVMLKIEKFKLLIFVVLLSKETARR